MRFSRSYTCFVMIGISIILFCIADSIDDSGISIAVDAFAGNLLGIMAISLMAVGIYLAVNSKRCAACGDIAPRHGIRCDYCGHKFKSNTALVEENRDSPHPVTNNALQGIGNVLAHNQNVKRAALKFLDGLWRRLARQTARKPVRKHREA